MPRNFYFPARQSSHRSLTGRLANLAGARSRLSYRCGHAVEVFLKNLFDRFRKAQRAPAKQIAERVVTHIEADFIVFHAGEGMASREGLSAQNRGVLQ